ncbi:MAG: YidB family protein [Pseudomonadales bacterium]|jgi:uncharacterized protein YidB (DUF937 family)
MDIMKLGISLLTKYFSGSVSEGQAGKALSGLLGDGQGGLDIAGLVSKFSGAGGLGSIVGSWLGDGANEGINPAQLMEVFGQDKLSAFAGNLGVDENSAIQGLSRVLPDLIDQSSSGGNLLDSVGGLSGAMDQAKKLF